MRALRSSAVAALAAATAATAVAGCAAKNDGKQGGGKGTIEVTATDSSCELSAKEFPAGHVRFAVQNKGSKVTEVYVYAPGDRIVTERENIGPGTSVEITAEVKAGSYEIACKPGMKGDGIRQKVTASGKGTTAKRDPAGRRGRRVPQVRPGAGRPDHPGGAEVRRRGQGRRPGGREEGLRPLAGRLGAHRAGRRVVR